jgi:hypothetical protein
MTPQEKAIDLFDKMYMTGIDEYDSKQCALITVDEVIEEYQSMSDLESILVINNELTFVIHKLVYWQEVKQEIDKL